MAAVLSTNIAKVTFYHGKFEENIVFITVPNKDTPKYRYLGIFFFFLLLLKEEVTKSKLIFKNDVPHTGCMYRNAKSETIPQTLNHGP